jgi:HD-like signal output (HDOD) protein
VFGLRAKVDSLPRAISLLGMKNTGALLHSEALRAALNDPLHAKALEHLWNRSAQIAEICVAVKKARLRDINVDVAFMLGMFHDCGLALLCKRFPAYAEALAEPATWPDIRHWIKPASQPCRDGANGGKKLGAIGRSGARHTPSPRTGRRNMKRSPPT